MNPVSEIPVRLAFHYCILPLEANPTWMKLLAPSDLSLPMREELRVLIGRNLEFVFSPRQEIEARLVQHYGVGSNVIDEMEGAIGKAHLAEVEKYNEESEGSMARLVNELIADGLNHRASDIHIEPFEETFRVRYRVDGLLQEAGISQKIKALAAAVIARIKVMAKLDLGEKRLPQDGRIKIRKAQQEFDLRVSVLPTGYGEAIVLRVLRPLSLLDLSEIGMKPTMIQMLCERIGKPQGLILVAGPTGSGKTTTLYSCLKELNQMHRKIITIEDPVEYKLPGIIQMQVNPKINFTFSAALRSILRHDPDCIMVGEIRDPETAKIAISSALTGHLVFSTLHANDSPSAIARLLEMGIEPYLVASSLELIVAQRLVRKRCSACDETQKVCAVCGGVRFHGRTGIYEMLTMSDRLRMKAADPEQTSQLRSFAMEEGFFGMLEDGMSKVWEGITTNEEIKRVI